VLIFEGGENIPKNSQEQINIDERKVINELKTSANKSINSIAKNCGFSRQKVWRIIKKLEKDNTIWGYGTVIDEEKQGLNYFILMLKRSTKPVKMEIVENITSREVDKHIQEMGCEMVTSLYVHGNYDWIIIFTAPNISQANRVSELFKVRYHEVLEEAHLLETIFPAKIHGIVNPEIGKLKTFF